MRGDWSALHAVARARAQTTTAMDSMRWRISLGCLTRSCTAASYGGRPTSYTACARLGQEKYSWDPNDTGDLGGGNGLKKESRHQLPQRLERVRGIDGRPQVRAVVEPLGVPRAEGSDFVDHPSIMPGAVV